MKQNPTSLALALSVLLSPLAMAVAVDGTWSATTDGNWSDPLNWSGGNVADGSGFTASFTSDITSVLPATTTVILDSSRSIGNLLFSDNGAAGSAWTISSNTLTLAAAATPAITTTTDATIGSILAGTQGLGKSGNGTLTLSAVNTYTGATAVDAGKLVIAPTVNVGNNGTHTQSSSSYSVASGATLRFDASNVQGGTAFAIWDINPVSVSAGGTLELFTTDTIHSNVGSNALLLYWGNSDQISGAGSLNKEGTGVFVINGNGTLNNFTGNLNVNQGTLAFQGGPTSAIGNFAVNVASGATYDIRTDNHKVGTLSGSGNLTKSSSFNSSVLTIGNNNQTGTFSGNIGVAAGTLALTKAGSGTQVCGGALTYNGATQINGGKLVIDGTSTNSVFTVNTGATLGGAGSIGGVVSVESGGFLAPGAGTGSSIGKLTVSNTLTLKTGSKTTCEINRTGGVLTNDQLFVNAVTYAGTLEVVASGDPLVSGDEFKLFDSAALPAGSFGAITLPSLGSGLVWDTSNLSTTGTIRVSNLADTPVFSPGEGNHLAPQTITMTSGSGTTVYYTFASGGSEPPNPTTGSASGTGGSGSASVNLPSIGTWKVKAMATKAGLGNSAVALGTFTLIPTPVWTNTAGGFWSSVPADAANWQGGLVAEGNGIPADFSTLALPADTTVTLDGDRTIGSLLFGDTGNQFGWTLDGVTSIDTLTLAGTTPSIAVSNQTATVSVPLAGTSGLTKSGPGDLVLAGTNTYTGTTTVNSGTLVVRPSNGGTALSSPTHAAVGASTLRIDGSAVTNGSFTNWQINAVGIDPGAKVELFTDDVAHDSSKGLILTGGTTGFTGSGALNKEGAGAIVVNNPNALNSFTGTLNINGGTFTLQGSTTSPTGNFAVNIASGATLDLRTDNQTLGAISGAGNIIKSFNGFNGSLTFGANNGNGNFTGSFNTPNTFNGVFKVGTGTQIFSGALSYNSATTVNGGKLVINGASTNSAFTVATGGTLGGTGTIGGSVSVQAGGIIAPGASAGTLSTGATTIAGTYACELDGASTDKLVAGGTLDVSTGTLAITTLGGGATQPVYIIATYTGAAPAPFASVTGLPEGYTVDYDYDNGVTTTNIALVSSTNSYGTWESDNGIAGAGSTVDSDGDGIANGIEFVIGGDPSGPGSDSHALLPTITTDATYLNFVFRRNDASASYNPAVEYSTTLGAGSWNTAQPGVGGVIANEDNDFFGAGIDRVTIKIPRTLAAPGAKLFARLRVDIP